MIGIRKFHRRRPVSPPKRPNKEHLRLHFRTAIQQSGLIEVVHHNNHICLSEIFTGCLYSPVVLKGYTKFFCNEPCTLVSSTSGFGMKACGCHRESEILTLLCRKMPSKQRLRHRASNNIAMAEKEDRTCLSRNCLPQHAVESHIT